MASSDRWETWSLWRDGTVAWNQGPVPAFDGGDWSGVERFLGLRLPDDFKTLVGAGGTLCLDDELYVMSPFDRSQNLLDHVCYGSWAAASVRATGFWELDYPVYPELGGILPWGMDGNGGIYYWDTTADDADMWTTVIDGRGVEMGPVACGVKAYLDGLINGTIRPASYDATDWPFDGKLSRVHGHYPGQRPNAVSYRRDEGEPA